MHMPGRRQQGILCRLRRGAAASGLEAVTRRRPPVTLRCQMPPVDPHPSSRVPSNVLHRCACRHETTIISRLQTRPGWLARCAAAPAPGRLRALAAGRHQQALLARLCFSLELLLGAQLQGGSERGREGKAGRGSEWGLGGRGRRAAAARPAGATWPFFHPQTPPNPHLVSK
jgi:hypothetical protein